MIHREINDYLGKKYNRLTIVEIPLDKFISKTKITLKCDCGNIHYASISNLERGSVQSCGCLKKENIGSVNKSHGKSNLPLYSVYKEMKSRCYNKNNHAYKDYGGRAIKICNEWLNSFESFFNWAISNGYNTDLQIDRVNNNGNYEPSNCRFVTSEIQSKNKRNNIIINVFGVDIKAIEFAKKSCVGRKAFYARLLNGWSLERAMYEKADPGKSLKLRA